MAPKAEKNRGDRAQAMEACASLVIGIVDQLRESRDSTEPQPKQRRLPKPRQDRRA